MSKEQLLDLLQFRIKINEAEVDNFMSDFKELCNKYAGDDWGFVSTSPVYEGGYGKHFGRSKVENPFPQATFGPQKMVWECSVCGTSYVSIAEAKLCETDHEDEEITPEMYERNTQKLPKGLSEEDASSFIIRKAKAKDIEVTETVSSDGLSRSYKLKGKFPDPF